MTNDTRSFAGWFVGVTLGAAAIALCPGAAPADTIDHIKKITPPDGVLHNQFGHGVAYNGVECFIGSPERNEGGTFASGAGYFFGKNLGGVDNWGFAVKQNEVVPGVAHRFGYSVGMTGSHAVAGVWGDDDNGLSSGGAYLYERNLGGIGAWGLRKKLLASDGAINDNFGWSVDMDDNVAIIGARIKNNSQGAAYIFQRNTGGTDNWGQSKKLVAPDAVDASFFGESVSVDNSIAAVGAFQDPALGNDSGAVYIFEELPAGAPEGPGSPRTDIWKFAKKLVAPDGGPNENFGWSVCVKNSYVAVGAPFHMESGTGVIGSVYLFHRNQGGAGNYGLVKEFKNPDTDNFGDQFGRGVDIDGDILVVGAALDGPLGDSAGAIFVYGKDIGGANNWGVLTRVKSPNPNNFDQLGFDVDIEGDTIVAGALGDSDIATFLGATHVFRINSICPEDFNGDGVVDTADLGVVISNFGTPGPAGDINLDGVVDTADLGALIAVFGASDCAFGP